MLGVAIMSKFACESCGSISIILPAELIDSAPVRCSGCGREYGCWAQFKEEAARIISAEPQHMNGTTVVIPDGGSRNPSRSICH